MAKDTPEEKNVAAAQIAHIIVSNLLTLERYRQIDIMKLLQRVRNAYFHLP